MTPQESAWSVVDALAERQAQLGLTNTHIERASGICHKDIARWQRREGLPKLSSLMAWADALGAKIVVRERFHG